VKNAKPIDILLVEDNPGDVVLTRKALAQSRVLNTLHVVADGDAALAFLRRQGEYADSARPGLILLDINLPGISGLEVLKEIKTDDELRRLPVIMLTTSRAEADIVKAYTDYASCYISKPIEMQDFFNVVKTMEDFWLTIVELPDGPTK
jgi:two-component system, chemotaxis family, response regulator Rcp1